MDFILKVGKYINGCNSQLILRFAVLCHSQNSANLSALAGNTAIAMEFQQQKTKVPINTLNIHY